MSPVKLAALPSHAVAAAVSSFYVLLGARLNDAKRDRGWSVRRLAAESGVSAGTVYLLLRGEPVSLEAAIRMVGALGLKLEWDLVDPRRKAPRPSQDIVHSAMGEFEAKHLRGLGFAIAMDEPYQHYQFAGRADLVAWDLDSRSLLHIENRTLFPDFQEAEGSFKSNVAYLGPVLAERNGIRAWRSETHVMACLWSSEMLHSLRLRTESFRAIAGGGDRNFAGWWAGNSVPEGSFAELVVIDPLATGRQRRFISLEEALTARPRWAGYREIAEVLAASR
jgi:transcriptional regulator with XRE-family HTH domain